MAEVQQISGGAMGYYPSNHLIVYTRFSNYLCMDIGDINVTWRYRRLNGKIA